MGNLFLLFTILTETAAIICMKLSAGFHNRLYTALAIASYGLSFVFLTLALKYLPAGITNAIWAGASTVLVTILGILIFREKLNAVQIASVLLIVIGLAGLNWKS
jgi:small multidrug resistance pump